MSFNVIELKAHDFAYGKRAADATMVTVDQGAGGASISHYLTDLSASYDTTGSSEVNVAGILKPITTLDLTDTDVLDLTADTFTLTGHGLTNGDKVMLNMNGGTAPTGVVAYTSYYVVGVSGADFQLAATVGGAAINMSGTQANFGTNCVIMPVYPSYQVYDHLEVNFPSPLKGHPNADLIVTLGSVTSVQGILNVAGYSKG